MTVHVDKSKSGKYVRYLLRSSFRVDGKVKHRTVANISHCSPQEIDAIKLALQHKGDLTSLVSLREDVTLLQGSSFGAVWAVYDMARQLGILAALGSTRQGKLALWQIIARVIDQGSRLSAVRLASSHAACDILGLDPGAGPVDLIGTAFARPSGVPVRQPDVQSPAQLQSQPRNGPTLSQPGLFKPDSPLWNSYI